MGDKLNILIPRIVSTLLIIQFLIYYQKYSLHFSSHQNSDLFQRFFNPYGTVGHALFFTERFHQCVRRSVGKVVGSKGAKV